MLRGGRPKDSVWDHFFLVEKDGKSFAKCKYCDKEQSMKAYRMCQHFQKYAVENFSVYFTFTKRLACINGIVCPWTMILIFL